MAVDKLVDSVQLDSDLEDIADAIRAKSGGSSPLAFPSGFISEVGNIPSGGGSGETLLESGTFTYAGASDNKMRIPVTFSGTATRAFVTAREIPSGVARTFLWFNGGLTFVDPVGNLTTTTITRKVAANGNQSNDVTQALAVESGNIVCSAAIGAYSPAEVTYDWYVWGYTT